MSTRFVGAAPGNGGVGRLEQVLRAGLALGNPEEGGRNVRQRTDTGPSTLEFDVTIAVAKWGLLAEFEDDPMKMRAEYGVSTNTRWKRTCETPWREMRSVKYKRLRGTLESIVADAQHEIMRDDIIDHVVDYNALYDNLYDVLSKEPTQLSKHRKRILNFPTSLEAFLCIRNAIKPRESGVTRFLVQRTYGSTCTEERNEKLMRMKLRMDQVVEALENGQWHTQGSVQGSMELHIRNLETEVDTLEDEERVEDSPQPTIGGQRPAF